MKPLLETIDTRFGTASKCLLSGKYPAPTGVPFGMNYFVPPRPVTRRELGSSIPSAHLSGDSINPPAQPWIGTTHGSF